jgi:uroporphyrin-III C-methyltransferase
MNKLDALSALRGHVWLAGAGPGDPGLLTLDALAGLAQADVIVHDALVGEAILALAGPQVELEYAGKRGGRPSAQQADISRRLIELARDNRRVLRLKGGDPCMFGRGGEEAIALAEAGVPYRIIPGVTAGLSGLSAASIPATMRGVNQAIIFATGHADGDFDWAALARTGQPIVIYMAMRNVAEIVEGLTRGGLAPQTPAAVIVAATTPEQRVVISRLDRLADEVGKLGFALPGLLVVGEIVTLRERLLRLARKAEAAR